MLAEVVSPYKAHSASWSVFWSPLEIGSSSGPDCPQLDWGPSNLSHCACNWVCKLHSDCVIYCPNQDHLGREGCSVEHDTGTTDMNWALTSNSSCGHLSQNQQSRWFGSHSFQHLSTSALSQRRTQASSGSFWSNLFLIVSEHFQLSVAHRFPGRPCQYIVNHLDLWVLGCWNIMSTFHPKSLKSCR